MSSPLGRLGMDLRRALLVALDAGRLTPPFTELALRRFVNRDEAAPLAAELDRLGSLGVTVPILREILILAPSGPSAPFAELVWTGPEIDDSSTRDTGVVVRELFRDAEREVLVVGFAVYQGRSVFEELAYRMDRHPDLSVKMYLNVDREAGDTRTEEAIVVAFSERFRSREWPGRRMPELFYDPRALEAMERGKKRACLHAKCVVVDGTRLLVSSANFTEAAQERNIELGLLLDHTEIGTRIRGQLESLVEARHLVRMPP